MLFTEKEPMLPVKMGTNTKYTGLSGGCRDIVVSAIPSLSALLDILAWIITAVVVALAHIGRALTGDACHTGTPVAISMVDISTPIRPVLVKVCQKIILH
jgi:hypothetical protein